MDQRTKRSVLTKTKESINNKNRHRLRIIEIPETGNDLKL